MSETVKRYEMYALIFDSGSSAQMQERSTGDWVRYADYSDLRTRLAECEKERDRALKYGAPENARAFVPRKTKCEHNEYWTTWSGHCMACRAVEAEKERDQLRSDAEVLAEIAKQADKFVRTHGGNGDPPAEYRKMKAMLAATDASGALSRHTKK